MMKMYQEKNFDCETCEYQDVCDDRHGPEEDQGEAGRREGGVRDMIMAVCGKGGVGKTTVSAVAARELSR